MSPQDGLMGFGNCTFSRGTPPPAGSFSKKPEAVSRISRGGRSPSTWRRFSRRTDYFMNRCSPCSRRKNRSEISKLHDSSIGNPKFRNRKLDCPTGRRWVQFAVSKFRVSNAGIVQFRDLRSISLNHLHDDECSVVMERRTTHEVFDCAGDRGNDFLSGLEAILSDHA